MATFLAHMPFRGARYLYLQVSKSCILYVFSIIAVLWKARYGMTYRQVFRMAHANGAAVQRPSRGIGGEWLIDVKKAPRVFTEG